MTTAVIFDLYGTLLRLPHDSQPYLQLARKTTKSLREAIHVALTTDCPGLSDFAIQIGLDTLDNLTALEYELKEDINAVEVYPDVLPTLKSLREAGIRIGVISNLATPYKNPFTDSGLEELVDSVTFSCDCGLAKPDPAIYKVALTQLNISAEDCIMVGDSLKSDVDGPAKIGIMGIHLVRFENPTQPNTIHSLDTLLEILNAFPV